MDNRDNLQRANDDAKQYRGERDLAIGRAIVEQLGGNQFIVMTGAKRFIAADGALYFNLPRYNHPGYITQIKIQLTPADDYTVLGFQNGKLLHTHEGIYSDTLREVCERMTGLVFTMAQPRRII